MDDLILFGQGFRGNQSSHAFHGFTEASTCLLPGHLEHRGEENFPMAAEEADWYSYNILKTIKRLKLLSSTKRLLFSCSLLFYFLVRHGLLPGFSFTIIGSEMAMIKRPRVMSFSRKQKSILDHENSKSFTNSMVSIDSQPPLSVEKGGFPKFLPSACPF
jgi:hypothetical protein